jgi:hypothetical protein
MEQQALKELQQEHYLDVSNLLPRCDLDLVLAKNTTLRYELLLRIDEIPYELRLYLEEPIDFDIIERYVVRATIQYPESVVEMTEWFIQRDADIHIITREHKTLYYRLLEDYTQRLMSSRNPARIHRIFSDIFQQEIPLDIYYLYLQWASLENPQILVPLNDFSDEVMGTVYSDLLTIKVYPLLLQNGMYDRILEIMSLDLTFFDTTFNIDQASPESLVDFLHLVVNPEYEGYFFDQRQQLLKRLLVLISTHEISTPSDIFQLPTKDKKEVVYYVLSNGDEVPKDYIKDINYNLTEIENLIQDFPVSKDTFEEKIRQLYLIRSRVDKYRESLYKPPQGTFYRKASQNYSKVTSDPWEREVVSPDRSWLVPSL